MGCGGVGSGVWGCSVGLRWPRRMWLGCRAQMGPSCCWGHSRAVGMVPAMHSTAHGDKLGGGHPAGRSLAVGRELAVTILALSPGPPGNMSPGKRVL